MWSLFKVKKGRRLNVEVIFLKMVIFKLHCFAIRRPHGFTANRNDITTPLCKSICFIHGNFSFFIGKVQYNIGNWIIQPGWGKFVIHIGVPCYVGKCTIYYHWLWLLINIIVTSYSRHSDWFHSNLKNWECALIIRIMNGTSTHLTRTPCHKACPNLVEWPIYQIIKLINYYRKSYKL